MRYILIWVFLIALGCLSACDHDSDGSVPFAPAVDKSIPLKEEVVLKETS